MIDDNEKLTAATEQTGNSYKPVKYHDLVQQMRIMDDEFMAEVFKDTEICSLLVTTILDKYDLEIVSAKTHYELFNFSGKSVELDVLAKDKNGTIYDIEIQNDHQKAPPRRLRYYSSLIDAKYLDKGQSYAKLPEKYVIFITDGDYYKKDKPLYEFVMTCQDKEDPFLLNDGQHLMYVNGDNASDTPLGRLMQDLKEPDPNKMHNEILRNKVNYYKNTQEGEKYMSDAVAKLYKEGRAEGRAEGEAKGRAEGKIEGRAEGKIEGRVEGKFEGIRSMAKYLKKILPKSEAIKQLVNGFGISEADANSIFTAA